MAEAAAPERAALWEAVRAGLRAQRSAPPIGPADRSGPLPASFAQQGLWLAEQFSGPSAQHNLCVAFRLNGRLDREALGRSLNTLVARHEALRTRLEWKAGNLRQIILPASPLDIPVQDLAGGEEEFRRIAEEEARRPFDITRPPLLRARVLRLGEASHGLALTFHHLAFDGWSFEVFMGELGQLYGAYRRGEASPLPVPALQYADYATWQRGWLQGDVLRGLQDYWLPQMAAPPALLQLPADRPRTLRPCRRGACLDFTLTARLSQACQRLAAAQGVTLFMLLLTAYQVLLYRHSGEEDVVVGAPVANRNRADLKGLVGLLVNTLALRSRVRGDLPFRRLLAQVRRTVLDAYARQDLPFEMLVAALQSPRRADTSPLAQAMFTYLNLPKSDWTLPGLSVEIWNVHNGTARYDLSLSLWESDGCLGGQFEYDAEMFDVRYMYSLLQQWENLLGGIVADPDCPVAALPLLSLTQTRELLALACGPTPDYPRDRPIHRVFEGVALARATATALICGAERLSYGTLNRRANQLAHYLCELAVGPGSLVGLRLPASPDYVVAVLAVLKLGAAYVPLDTGEPPSRIEAALRGARLAAVLTRTALLRDLAGLEAPKLALDTLDLPLGGYSNDDPVQPVEATDLAYVMFTSGSTGAPKGVCIPHRGVVRLACTANYAELGPDEVMLLLAPLAFDASTFELWGALLSGATLVIPPETRPSLSDIAALIRDQGVSTLWLTTGLFELMLDAEPAALAGLRQLLVGGDVLSPGHARRYLRLVGAGRLINCYGPTENTTFTTFHRVSEADMAGPIPIGRPISHSAIYVLDERRRPVPPGVIGEAWVAGDGLMLGYLNDAVANAASLVSDPFFAEAGALMYRTGDRVRLRADGNLQFVGRRDRQVKLRGYRVEPGEVEAVLADHPRITRACALIEGEGSDKRLLAYVVGRSSEDSTSELVAELRIWLRRRLPEPLRPAEILVLPSLPLNANGKLDHAALPRPPVQPAQDDAPEDALEGQIAEAFAQVLRRRCVGRHENFFESGGHSLLALQLLVLLESALNLRLPFISLFEHTTPARLAAHIRTNRSSTTPMVSGVAEIRRGSAEPPLFMVPGGHGGRVELTLYARLMQYLDRDLAVYGLLAEGADGKRSLPASVAEMAATYLTRLRQLQPHGPYALAGECVGGVIAYEMAQQLSVQGETVALLLLLDTWCPSTRRRRYYRWLHVPLRILRLPWSRWRKEWDDLRGAMDREIGEPTARLPRRGLGYFRRAASTLIRIVRAWWRRRALGRHYIGLTMRYQPSASAIPLHLLLSGTNHRLGLARDWKPLADRGLQLWVAPGTHESYLRETPETAARALNACLDAVFGRREQTHASSQDSAH